MGEEDERFSAGADSAGRGADRVRAACVDPVARRTQGRQGHDRRVADAGGVCKESGDLVRERQAVKFAAIADWADSSSYPVAFMCVELGVSRSGYYAWRTAAPPQRSQDDTTLIAIMKKLHAEARGNPGVRRLHAGLAALGHRLSRKRVWRLMKVAGLRGRHPKAWKRTTIGGDKPVPAPDLIGRSFCAERPNEKWCGDITYVKTWDGWAYVATVIDLYSRKLVGCCRPYAHRARHGRFGYDYRQPPAAGGRDLTFRPRSAVHLRRFRSVLQEEWYQTFPGQDRYLLRQCRIGIDLRDLQERADPHSTVANNGRSQKGD